MQRRSVIKTAGTVPLLGVGGLAGCSTPQADDDSADGGGEDGNGRARPTEIQMVTDGGDYYFDPIGLLVDPGTTITWVIDSGSHSTTAYEEGNGPAEVTRIPEGAEAWDSGVLSNAGATFEYTFEVQGTYDFFCISHKTLGMVGRVIVESPGGPAEGSMPPDGDVPDSQTIVDEGAVSFDAFNG